MTSKASKAKSTTGKPLPKKRGRKKTRPENFKKPWKTKWDKAQKKATVRFYEQHMGIHERLESLAKQSGRSINEIVLEAIYSFVK